MVLVLGFLAVPPRRVCFSLGLCQILLDVRQALNGLHVGDDFFEVCLELRYLRFELAVDLLGRVLDISSSKLTCAR